MLNGRINIHRRNHNLARLFRLCVNARNGYLARVVKIQRPYLFFDFLGRVVTNNDIKLSKNLLLNRLVNVDATHTNIDAAYKRALRNHRNVSAPATNAYNHIRRK